MSEVKPVVLVDMDGVLADFDGATIAHLQSPEINIPLRPHSSFYHRDNYTDPSHVKAIDQLHASRNFFRTLPLVDGALEGWQAIEELGYEPRICSSPLHTNEWCVDEKREWIKEHLGARAASAAIIDSRKELYGGIALIDDRPVVKNAEVATWQHVVFDASYNREVESDLRLTG